MHVVSRVVASDRRRWLAAAAAGSVALLLLWQVSAPPPALLFGDFVSAYYKVGERIRLEGIGPTWPLREICVDGFVNIPALGLPFVPFAYLERGTAAWLFLLLGVLSLPLSAMMLMRLGRASERQGPLILLMILSSGPVAHSLREGNITHFVLAMLAGGLLLWRSGRGFSAGIVLGLVAALKLPLLLLGGYFLVRRRWSVVAGGATALLAIAALSLATFGTDVNIGWYQNCVAPFLGRTLPGFNVQSVDTFVFRILNGDRYLHYWYLLEPTAAHRALRGLMMLAIAGPAVGVLWRGRGSAGAASQPAPTTRDLAEVMLVLTLAIVISPVSWSHYYLLLLLPWSLHLTNTLGTAADPLARRLMVTGGVLAMAPVIMLPTDLGPHGGILARLLVSHYFYGGLLTLAALAIAIWRGRTQTEARDDAPGLARLLAPGAIAQAFGRRQDGALPGPALLTRGLAVLLLSVLILNGLLWLFAPPGYDDVALTHVGDFLLGYSDTDSWGPMSLALGYYELEYLDGVRSLPMYSELVFHRGEKFQYPPTALFVLTALRAVEDAGLLGADTLREAVSWASVPAVAVATAVLLERRLRAADEGFCTDYGWLVRGAVSTALVLCFYPVVKAYTLGQIQVWLNAGFALVLLGWSSGHRIGPGVVIGLMTMIKPHYGLLLLWAATRREWRALLAGTAVVAAGFALSLLAFGWATHADYLVLLSHISERGEAFYPNQSVNGLLNRLMSISSPDLFNNLHWIDGYFPPPTPWIAAATLLTSVLILATALARGLRAPPRASLVDLCTMALSCTIASPVAWEHHYGILPPILAVLVAGVLADRRRLWLAGAAFLLTALYIPATKLVALTLLNPVQSHLFASAAVVLVLLHRSPLWAPSPASAPAGGSS